MNAYIQLSSNKLEELEGKLLNTGRSGSTTEDFKIRSLQTEIEKLKGLISTLNDKRHALSKEFDDQFQLVTRGQSQLSNEIRHNKELILNFDQPESTTTMSPLARPSRALAAIKRRLDSLHLESARNFSNVADQWIEMSGRILSLEKKVEAFNFQYR